MTQCSYGACQAFPWASLKPAYSLLYSFDLAPLDLQEHASIKPVLSLAE